MSENNQGDAGRLLLKDKMDLDDAADFEAMHKKAFRLAFDYMHACFPPTRSEEYWVAAVQKMGKIIEENKQNMLTKYLLLGVYDYLGEIVKDLKEESDSNDKD